MTRLDAAGRMLARYFGLRAGAVPAGISRWGPESGPAVRGLRRNWPYLALLVIVVAPLLWIAAALAVRSGVIRVTGPPPSSEQLTALMTFIGGGFATCAALVATLFTRDHNKREQQRLRLETVAKSLETLPPNSPARISGYTTTLMLLGEPEIALRVLDSAWKAHDLDAATATWVIDKVLFSADHIPAAAVRESVAILMEHVKELTDPAVKHLLYFPGHYLRRWKFDREPAPAAREGILQIMAEVLLSRDPDWWLVDGVLPAWPTEIFAHCVQRETDERIRACAAVLLDALFRTFPKGLDERLGATMRERVADAAGQAGATVPPTFLVLAGQIEAWAVTNDSRSHSCA
jgi:hypothetical protein